MAELIVEVMVIRRWEFVKNAVELLNIKNQKEDLN
jgi:hypothetical protein